MFDQNLPEDMQHIFDPGNVPEEEEE